MHFSFPMHIFHGQHNQQSHSSHRQHLLETSDQASQKYAYSCPQWGTPIVAGLGPQRCRCLC